MNLYTALNIPKDANAADIKRAYFGMVKKFSPDADPGGFKIIRSAYETLSNPNKRKEYDARFIDGLEGDIQEILLTGRGMLEKAQFAVAIDFLANAAKNHPDTPVVITLYAEALWSMKKTVTAEKVLKDLLASDPAVIDAHILRAKIAASRGHTNKAGEHFRTAIAANPDNPDLWAAYFRCATEHRHLDVSPLCVFGEATKTCPDFFKDNYPIYLEAAIEHEKSWLFTRLFGEEIKVPYYDIFIKHFLNDTNPTKETINAITTKIPKIVKPTNPQGLDFLAKILPALEASSHVEPHILENYHLTIIQNKLQNDAKIHDVLADLTENLLENGDSAERRNMEHYIIQHLSSLRPSIKHLQTAYPKYFALNEAFYTACLNPPQTFNRATPKTGRNDPCPCNSGKKYKACCLNKT